MVFIPVGEAKDMIPSQIRNGGHKEQEKLGGSQPKEKKKEPYTGVYDRVRSCVRFVVVRPQDTHTHTHTHQLGMKRKFDKNKE